MTYDLLINLYQKEEFYSNDILIKDKDVVVKRLLSPNADDLIEFVESNFSKKWASEIKAAVYKSNPTCFVAVKNSEIIGFSCYDATAKSYFGPTGVSQTYRKNNIGQVLFLKTLDALKHDGYGYAIVGGVSRQVESFYSKYVICMKLSFEKNLYKRLINY